MYNRKKWQFFNWILREKGANKNESSGSGYVTWLVTCEKMEFIYTPATLEIGLNTCLCTNCLSRLIYAFG